ncbi:MAG: glycosyl hydrolase family 18 protein, partial [Clostridium sp.]
MSYDMRGAWDDKSGHQTGLYSNPNDNLIGRGLSIDESVNYLLSQGAEASKVVIGAAYYTRGWEKVTSGPDANNPGLFGDAAVVTKDADQTPSRGAKNEAPLKSGDGGRMSGIWSYRNLDKLKAEYPGIKEYWDDTAKAPYLYDEKTGAFFTYDNVKSIEEKAKYVNENDLGGMIAWMASNDKETTSTKRDELTKATKEGLFGQDDLEDFEIKYADVDIDASIKPYKESWGSNGGYEITFTNKEKLEESNEVLGAVEQTAETIKLPKLYIKNNGGPLTSGDYLAGTVTNKDGYTIVDLSSIYDAKNIVPGRTYTFRLKAQTAPENINAIESIEITQRINPTGKEVNRQVIFGNKDTETPQNSAPELRGVGNREIKVNDSFNPLAGVTAFDKEDGDITANIKVVNNVNVAVAGSYEVTYTVSDGNGLTTTKKSSVKVVEEVIEENTAPILNGLSDKTIVVGESFDKMVGVTATDLEDGDLTSKIKVEGNVDTNKAGVYSVKYTVEDSKGLVTTKIITVTVKEKEVAPD